MSTPPNRQLVLPEGACRVPPPGELHAQAQRLADALQGRLGAQVALSVTDNRQSLVSVKKVKGVYRLRVHHMFLRADAEVIGALADFARGRRPKGAGQLLDAWIAQHPHLIRPNPAAGPEAPRPPQGRFHDLQALFEELNARYFGGEIVARVGWSRRGRQGGPRKSLKLGSYHHAARLIRLHPALDQAWVPQLMVEWVLYHEMLHQAVPPRRSGGRTYYHTPEFRRREALFAQAEEARRWEERHLSRLLGR